MIVEASADAFGQYGTPQRDVNAIQSWFTGLQFNSQVLDGEGARWAGTTANGVLCTTSEDDNWPGGDLTDYQAKKAGIHNEGVTMITLVGASGEDGRVDPSG